LDSDWILLDLLLAKSSANITIHSEWNGIIIPNVLIFVLYCAKKVDI